MENILIPDSLRPYAKVINGTLTAILTAGALVVLGKLGIAVDNEILDLGPESEEITWRQAINALVPLVAVYVTSNGANVEVREEPDAIDSPDVTTFGTNLNEYYAEEGALQDSPPAPFPKGTHVDGPFEEPKDAA